MTQDKLKLVFDALKQCNVYAFAGGFGKRAKAHRDAVAILEKALAQPEQEPVAWRVFDGEGLYFYCEYEGNEDWGEKWNKRNPNHKGWVDKLYTHSQRTDKERILQLIKELRPAIKPLEGMGKGKTTQEWFDILTETIKEKL